MSVNAVKTMNVIEPERVIPAVTETVVTLEMDEKTALQVLALLGLCGGHPDTTARGHIEAVAVALQKALGLPNAYVSTNNSDFPLESGARAYWKGYATREMFESRSSRYRYR